MASTRMERASRFGIAAQSIQTRYLSCRLLARLDKDKSGGLGMQQCVLMMALEGCGPGTISRFGIAMTGSGKDISAGPYQPSRCAMHTWSAMIASGLENLVAHFKLSAPMAQHAMTALWGTDAVVSAARGSHWRILRGSTQMWVLPRHLQLPRQAARASVALEPRRRGCRTRVALAGQKIAATRRESTAEHEATRVVAACRGATARRATGLGALWRRR